MKYKVGDIIELRDDLEVGERYGEEKFYYDMEFMKGRPKEILLVNRRYSYYKIHDGDSFWIITDEMIKGYWRASEQVTGKLESTDISTNLDENNVTQQVTDKLMIGKIDKDKFIKNAEGVIVTRDDSKVLPVIEFAKDLDEGRIGIGGHLCGESKILVFSKLNEKVKVGTCKESFEKKEILGLMFYHNESIDVLIRHLERLKSLENTENIREWRK